MSMRRILSFLLIMLAIPAVVFGANATDVVRRAQVADKFVNYRGMKTANVCLGGSCSATATLKIVHLKPDKTRTQYFTPQPLAGIIIIQDGSDSWKYSPKENEWEQVRLPSTQSICAIKPDALDNYDIRLVGTDRVAGRQTYVVQAVPRNPGEHTRRIWVDREYYLIIGTQVENGYGSVINSSRYTSVEFNPRDITASIFKVSGKIKPAQPRIEPVQFKTIMPSYLPNGYRFVGVSCMRVNGCSCAHVKFSNGVNTISLFQHRSPKDLPPSQIDSKVTNVLNWARSGMQFTLMGDIPRAELQKIANSTK